MNNRNGRFLKILRENSKLSQKDVAKRMHVLRQTISNWELNKTVADLDNLRCLATIYNYNFNDMIRIYMRIDDEPSPEEIALHQARQKELACGDAAVSEKEPEKVKEEEKNIVKPKRKMHPLLKTALFTAGITTAILALVVIFFAIFLPINAVNKATPGDFAPRVYYYFDYAQIILILIGIILATTLMSMAVYAVIQLIKIKKRRK